MALAPFNLDCIFPTHLFFLSCPTVAVCGKSPGQLQSDPDALSTSFLLLRFRVSSFGKGFYLLGLLSDAEFELLVSAMAPLQGRIFPF